MQRDWFIDRRRFGIGAMIVGFPGSGTASEKSLVRANTADPSEEAQVGAGADHAQRMTVPVRIDGEGPFEFVVDTGANRSAVSGEIAMALDLPDAGSAEVHSVSGVERVRTAAVRRLQVGAVQSFNLGALVLPRDRLGADGLLGVDVLRDRRVLMNFQAKELVIGSDQGGSTSRAAIERRRGGTGTTASPLGLRVAVPARYRFGQLIIIGAEVSGRPVTAFIDSGSQSTVGNRALQQATDDGSAAAPRALYYGVRILSATGQTSEGDAGTLPALKIGGLTMSGLTITYADIHVFTIWGLTKRPSLLLGMDVLSQFNAVEVNYAQREVAFYLPGKDHH